MNLLTVPIRVDALVADYPTNTVRTSDEFDDLPYLDKENIDINYDTANLASSIANKAFNQLCTLPAGIHLHWSLPDALANGEATDNGLKMPKVPNRWLVLRCCKDNGNIEKSWIVESDYIHADGEKPERAICIPNLDNGKRAQQPYHYLGRQLEVSDWLNETQEQKTQARYLPELNVLGWGTPYFTSLYTDCYSVFGAFDSEITSVEVTNYDYQVYGWHSNGLHDYVQDELLENEPSLTEFVAAVKESANWAVEGDVVAERLLCYGKVQFDEQIQLSDGINAKETQFSLAKSPLEAVAAHLAKQYVTENVETASDIETKAEIEKLENQLLAGLINDDDQGQNIDFFDRLKTGRHEQEFVAISSGDLWQFVADETLFVEAEGINENIKIQIKSQFNQFKTEAQSQLVKLNHVQELANKNSHTLQFYRRLLYSDWTKYMLSLHPTYLQSVSYPDFNQISFIMEQDTLTKLLECEQQQQTLLGEVETIEQALIAAFKVSVNMNENEFNLTLRDSPLVQVPGPRYWKPKDPTLLLSGEVVNPSRRHGKDGLLNCQVVKLDSVDAELSIISNISDISKSLITWLMGSSTSTNINTSTNSPNTEKWTWQTHGINQWQKQPWSPLFMEWRVAGFPEERSLSNLEGENYQYDSNYVNNQYRIPLNDETYALPSSAVDLVRDRTLAHPVTESPNTVNGRSLLTFSLKKVVVGKIKQYLNDTADDQSVDDQSVNDQSVNEQSGKQEIAEFNQRLEAIVEQYQANPTMMQTLDGLHEEFLMYSNLTLLQLNDPSRFSDVAGFSSDISEQVKHHLSGKQFKLPSISHRFTPIKNGDIQIEQVRVVDTFGRYKNLVDPHRLPQGSRLPSMPRVLSPMRLSFRWLDLIEQQTQTVSPISGWLGYNLFNETIVIYDPQGEFIGAINSDGEWTNYYGDKQSLLQVTQEKLRLLILKLLSFHHHNRLSKAKSLSVQGIAEQGMTELLWQKLVNAGVLSPYKNGTKAYLNPITQAHWPQDLGLTFEQAQLVFSASKSSSNYWPKLKQAIRRGQDNIEPVGGANNMYCPFVPLAIVSAELDLQLMGEAEVDKSWQALNEYLLTGERRNRKFTQVKWPIKLGEYNNIDDGLIAYWPVTENRLSETGFFPQSDMGDEAGESGNMLDAAGFNPQEHDYVDQVRGEGVANLTRSLKDESIEVLMLMDAQSSVHATTGIVPRKALTLAPEHYVEPLKNIQSDYFAAPLLTPKDTFSIPLSGQTTWRWQQRDTDGNIQEKLSGRLVSKVSFLNTGISTSVSTSVSNTELLTDELASGELAPEEFASEEQWQWLIEQNILTLIPDTSEFALLNSIDLSQQDENWLIIWKELEPVVQASSEQQITPLARVGVLSDKLQAIEGWLKPLANHN